MWQLLQDADLVARVHIVEFPDARAGQEPGEQRPLVAAKVLEVYKGEAASETLEFAQHGHGVAQYEVGDEALVFLRRIERSRELDQLAAAGAASWVSLQEHDSALKLTSATRPAFATALCGYRGAAATTDPAARIEALGRVTLELLRSPEPWLARSALRDLVLMGGALASTEMAAELTAISDDPDLDVGLRLGVITVLEQQGLVDGPARWAQLLRATPRPDLPVVIRAVAAHPSPPVTAELVKLLAGTEVELAAAAAVSLGVPGNRAAVEPLARALDQGEERLRMAAIRGLGGIATEEALAVLRRAAAGHPDPATRRRAAGELGRLREN